MGEVDGGNSLPDRQVVEVGHAVDAASLSEFLIAGPITEETGAWIEMVGSEIHARDRFPQPWWHLSNQLLKAFGVLVTEAYLVHPECEVRGEDWGYYVVPDTSDQSDPTVWGPEKAYILGEIENTPGPVETSPAARLIGGLADAYLPPVYTAKDVFRPARRADGRCWTIGPQEEIPAGLPAETVRVPLIRLITLNEGLKGKSPLVTREHLLAAAQVAPESVLAHFLVNYELARSGAWVEMELLCSDDGQRLLRIKYSFDGELHIEKRLRKIRPTMPSWRFIADIQLNIYRGLKKLGGNWNRFNHLRPELWKLLEKGAEVADDRWETPVQEFLTGSSAPRTYAEQVVFGILRLVTESKLSRGTLVRPCARPECRRLFWLRDRKVKMCELHRGTHNSHSSAAERRRQRAEEASRNGVTEQREKWSEQKRRQRAKVQE